MVLSSHGMAGQREKCGHLKHPNIQTNKDSKVIIQISRHEKIFLENWSYTSKGDITMLAISNDLTQFTYVMCVLTTICTNLQVNLYYSQGMDTKFRTTPEMGLTSTDLRLCAYVFQLHGDPRYNLVHKLLQQVFHA